MARLTRKEYNQLKRQLQTAVEWLDSEQPEDAVISHMGLTCIPKIPYPMTVNFVHVSFQGYPAVIFSLPRDSRDVQSVFTDHDVAQLRRLVGAVYAIVGDWNGAGTTSYTAALDRFAGEDVLNLYRNYKKYFLNNIFGVPEHYKKLAVLPDGWR